MVELRKRPPPKDAPASQPAAKRGSGAGAKVKKMAEKAKETVMGATPSGPPGSGGPAVGDDDAMVTSSTGAIPETTTTPADATPTVGAPATANSTLPANSAAVTSAEADTGVASPLVAQNGTATSKLGKESVGTTITLEGFGGMVTRHDGVEVTMKELVEGSGSGVVVFTYPKASTPGCTTQACLFRDSYAPITGASLSVYGLSTDSGKANTTFVNKNSLPYPLLCDPNATLTSAIGMKKPGAGKSTARGVVIIDKQGVVKLWEQAGPQKTHDAVIEYIKTSAMTDTGAPTAVAAPPADDPRATEAAARLADPWGEQKMDEVPLIRTPTNEQAEVADTAAEVGDASIAAKLDSNEMKA